MSIAEEFRTSYKFVNKKILWIIVIPIMLDLITLFSWKKIFQEPYSPVQKIVSLKLGFVDAPPSVKFLLEDFPTPLYQYNSNGFSGIINKFSFFNVTLLITVLLITGFINSGYMSVISSKSIEDIRVKDFFISGNRKWYKFFVFNFLASTPMLLMSFNKNFIYLSFLSILFIYVKYSFVIDEVGILENFKIGLLFLKNNLWFTIKMLLYFGVIFSLISIIVFPIASLGDIGIVIDMVICAYLGTCVNRVVLEIYRQKVEVV